MNRAADRGSRTCCIRNLLLLVASCAALAACGGGSGAAAPAAPPPPPPPQFLTQADVTAIVQAAATAAQSNTMAIAVVDRLGRILAVYKGPATPALVPGNFGVMVPADDLAVSLARTGAFFSNNQAPLSSRTVRYISGVHFPPGITNTPNAALYGIENTNRGCTLSAALSPTIPPATTISGATPGLGIATGKADTNDSDPTAVNPGGVPIFKNGQVVGGVGITGVALDVAEFVAFSAARVNTDGIFIDPAALPFPGEVVIDGVALPFVDQTTAPAGVTAGTFNAANFTVGPVASPGAPPDGDLIPPMAGPVGGLTAAQVTQIVANAVATASITRALIRLPLGSRTRMTIAVSDLDGTLIALHRMPDGTVFSIDVAATKARNVIYFSGPTRQPMDLNDVPMGTAVTNRTISFGAQPFFPPGIAGSGDGPFFNIYTRDVANACTQGFEAPGPNQSGIVFFPGSEPLYINGNLVGGLGVSGDGVDQDDYVTAGGAAGFEPAAAIRADQIFIDGVRLPYLKFPRNPTD
ncbi:MAG TPA: heme-binding protein [Candidatus Sulfotelmatobacter sp.]|nr:heme-binding protein [Candidatus Sulfotelmatobacter sp.]